MKLTVPSGWGFLQDKYVSKSLTFLRCPKSPQGTVKIQSLSCWDRFFLDNKMGSKVVNILPLKWQQSHKGAVKTQQLSCLGDTI